MTLTIKLDRNWSSFQLANSTPPLSVTGSAIAPSARMIEMADIWFMFYLLCHAVLFACFLVCELNVPCLRLVVAVRPTQKQHRTPFYDFYALEARLPRQAGASLLRRTAWVSLACSFPSQSNVFDVVLRFAGFRHAQRNELGQDYSLQLQASMSTVSNCKVAISVCSQCSLRGHQRSTDRSKSACNLHSKSM